MKGKKLAPVIGFALFVLGWGVIGNIGLVDPLYVPRIGDVFDKLILFFRTGGVKDVATTLMRVGVSFLISAFLGITCGMFLGTYKRVYVFFEVLIDFFRSVPSIAFYPLFLLILGIGDLSKIGLASFVSFWIILINTIYGVWNSSKIRIKVAKVFKCSDIQIFRRVVFFEALPQIFAGLKTAISVTLVMIIVTEMFLGTKYGLGAQIFESYSSYDTAKLYAQVVIIGLIGYSISKLFILLEKRVVHWI